MKYLSIIFFCFNFINLNAQIVDLKPSVFTLQNAKVSVGFTINGSIANGESKSFMNQFTGVLPSDVEVRFDTTQGFPNLSLGVNFDIFSPNSNIGFLAGVEYAKNTFQLVEQGTNINYFEINQINIPVYLKWKFGNVQSQGNAFLAAGAAYGIPFKYSKKNSVEEISDKNDLKNTLSLSSILGYQVRLVKNVKLESNTNEHGVVNGEYSRVWLFLRADYALGNTFNETSTNNILTSYSNSEFEYRNLGFTIGASIFFGFKGN